MTWVFLRTGELPGAVNMEVDTRLADFIAQREGLSIVRVYGWNPPAISLGYNQREEEFDNLKLRNAGIDLVRRPTGGRAILHWNELTYSVVTPIGDRSLKAIYHEINCALLNAVHRLQIGAQLVETGSSSEQLYREQTSVACFSSSAKSEIQYGGRKLIGSAQRRLGKIVLQHGSFLLGPQHVQISSFFNTGITPDVENITNHLIDHAIDAETILQRNVSFDETADCIKQGFEERMQIRFEEPAEELRVFLESMTGKTHV